MKGKFVDLTGKKLGLLTVVERAPNDQSGSAYWWCVYACGQKKIVSSCVNPEHLFLGSHDDNMEDMARKSRAKVTKVYLHPTLRKKLVQEYLESGVPHAKLASDYGISISTVRRVLRRAHSGGM